MTEALRDWMQFFFEPTLESAHRIREKYDHKIDNKSSNKNPTINISLRRLHGIFVFNVAASHFLALTNQNSVHISAQNIGIGFRKLNQSFRCHSRSTILFHKEY